MSGGKTLTNNVKYYHTDNFMINVTVFLMGPASYSEYAYREFTSLLVEVLSTDLNSDKK